MGAPEVLPQKEIVGEATMHSRDDNAKSFAPTAPFNGKEWSLNQRTVTKRKENVRSIYMPVKFWIEDPVSLFQTFDIVPNPEMTDAERLNAMTRVIIVITAIMFVLKFPIWWLFLGIGLIVVIIMWYIIKERERVYAKNARASDRRREYLRRPRRRIITPISNISTSVEPRNSNIIRPTINVNSQQLRIISIP